MILENHKIPFLKEETRCKVCGTEFQFMATHETHQGFPQGVIGHPMCECGDELQARRMARGIEQGYKFWSTVPKRYQGYLVQREPHWENFTPFTKSYVEDDLTLGSIMLITGRRGRGKTEMALWATMHHLVLRQGLKACFVGESDFFAETLAAIGQKKELPNFAQHQVLVLDDFARQKPTEAYLSRVYHLIEHYYSQQKTLIVTSNRTPAEIFEYLGGDSIAEGILSRLQSGVSCEALDGPDERLGETL